MSEFENYGEDEEQLLREDAETIAALVAKHDDATWRSLRIGEWSAKEVLGHLADCAEVAAERVRRCVLEERPFLLAFDQDELARERRNDERDLARLSDRLSAANEEITTLLAEPWNLDRPAVHAEKGDLTAGHIGADHAEHVHEHVEELRAVLEP